jgi:hypothetical protein
MQFEQPIAQISKPLAYPVSHCVSIVARTRLRLPYIRIQYEKTWL